MNNIHGENDWKALFSSFNNNDFYPFHETGDVGGLKIPSMCLIGGDSVFEFTAAVQYRDLNRKINTAIIPFAGHLVHRDQPELYTKTLEAFLEKLNK
ncbi:pimeloyl-ACP methyl ester carboxylesterase [Cytobacillus purgationiresistens]|uniref:Pimeloyl-ACP methyl ester carboxylesterase n=1 Tax=Cytobacillus purgationiresistens TaxID=863449 RepID=A0ABU0AC06_9BACI|nr:pimeloyl-ACP methyl ester carboxylesterase [Cytobacillus purgationiresistens]